MKKEDWQFSLEVAGKALVSLVPLVGGIISSIGGDVLADRKEQRLKELLISLEQDLSSHKEEINHTFVSQDDFADIFEQTLKKVMAERSEAKRVAYKNILLTGILSHFSYDDVEYQMKILDQLLDTHLLVLKFFNSPNNFYKGIDSIGTASNLKILLRKIFPNWDYDVLFDTLVELENIRLIDKISSDLMSMSSGLSLNSFEGRLTSKGKSFVVYILR